MTMAVFVFPNATGHVIDHIIPESRRGIGEFSLWIFVALVGFLAKDGLNSLRIFINNTFEQKVIFDIRSDLYAKIQRLPLRWFDTRRTGDIMTRVVEDVTNMERVLIDGIEQGLIAALQVLGVGVFLFFLNPDGGGVGHAAGALPRARRVDLLDQGARPLPQPARRGLRSQRAAARQHLRHPPDQGLRRGRQPSTRASTAFPTSCGRPRCA